MLGFRGGEVQNNKSSKAQRIDYCIYVYHIFHEYLHNEATVFFRNWLEQESGVSYFCIVQYSKIIKKCTDEMTFPDREEIMTTLF